MGNGLLASHPGNRLETMSQKLKSVWAKGRLGYALDDGQSSLPSHPRDPEDVSTSWQIDAYEFDVPVIGAPWIR